MRHTLLGAVVALIVCHAVTARADESSLREAEIVDLKLQLLMEVEFPLRLRKLETEIKLAEHERKHAQRLFRDVDRIDSRHSVVTKAAHERAKITKLKSEYRLRDLRHERSLLLRYQASERRLRRLLMERTAAFGSQF